ncbi:hypothetical protein GJ496_011978 [Pomphorhynchus laevis]|nr:hypothetical protein GJ496_011978 [Pomphorhynchus laevis]
MPTKPCVSLLVCGHVDAGKSTLVGNLLFNLGLVDKKHMHKYEQESKKIGKGSFAFAWVMDESSEERNRGVTIDVAQRQFETDHLLVNVLDAPGHKDFVPNMITGAAQSDAALLVVDCNRGEFEAGFTSHGQTKEHLVIAKSLGVNQIIVAVNKMDTVDWSESRFLEIQSMLGPFLKTLDYKSNAVYFVPCSGLLGSNILKPMDKELSWYKEKLTILQAIDKLKAPNRCLDTDVVRFFVSDAYKLQGSLSGCQGRLEMGRIKPGDKVTVCPSKTAASIKEVHLNENEVEEGFAGQMLNLVLTGIQDDDVLIPGSVICSPDHLIHSGTMFLLRLLVLGQQPLVKGLPVTFHYKSIQCSARVLKLNSQIDRVSGDLLKKNPRVLVKRMAGTVTVEIHDRPICVELFSMSKELSRFTLRVSNETFATGKAVLDNSYKK